MASPQRELGFSGISNELLEAVIRWPGPGRVKDLLFAVMRETYGRELRKEARIPACRLVTLLQVSERRVRQLREQAVACNVVTYDQKTGVYAVQKDYDLWTDGTARPMDEETKSRLAEARSAEGPYTAGPPSAEEAPPAEVPYTAEAAETDPEEDAGAEGPYTANPEGGPSALSTTEERKKEQPRLTSLSATADAPADGPPPRAPKLDPSEELATARAQFIPEDLLQVDAFIGMVGEHRANGRLNIAGERTMTLALLKLRQETGITSAHFAHGVEAAVLKPAPNTNYVAAAARGYKPGGNGKVGTQRYHPPTVTADMTEAEIIGGWGKDR